MKWSQPAPWLLSVGFGSLLILAGCSDQATREGFAQVQGKITFLGKPLTGGSIHFFQDQKKVGSFMIRGDGAYAAEVPLGPLKVAIETVSVKYQDRQALLKVMKEQGYEVDPDQRDPKSPALTALKTAYVEIPDRFGDPEKSGLEYTVVRGQQTCDFDLK
jgi:hypothetical protein